MKRSNSTNRRLAATILFALLLLGLGVGVSLDSVAALKSDASAAGNLNEVLGRLQEHYQAIRSLSAKFDQTITRAAAPPLHRSGVIYYQKPGKLRWEFESPQSETIVIDGKTVYDYDPGLNQVVETPVAQAFRSNAAAAFLLGVGNLKRDFKAEEAAATNSDGLMHLVLTPKQGGERIETGIDPKTYNIALLSIGDTMGNRSTFAFREVELNQPLPASQFTFAPPEGADIVKPQATK
jgi:outer membrane lipoprotein carrier protein